MKRLPAVPVLLFAVAANAYDRVPPEPIIQHMEPVSQEAVDLVDALNEHIRTLVEFDAATRRISVRYMVRRSVLVTVPFNKDWVIGARYAVDTGQTRKLCELLWKLIESNPLPGSLPLDTRLNNAGINGIAMEAVNYTCSF